MIQFQFDLRHIEDHSNLHVTFDDRTFDLIEHSPVTKQDEVLLRHVPPGLVKTIQSRFTHFAAIDGAALSGDAVSWIKVCRKAQPGIPLDTPVLVAQHIPKDHLRAFYRRQLRGRRRAAEIAASEGQTGGPPALYSHKLEAWGLGELPQDEDEAIQLLLSTQELIGLDDTAASLVAHHPALASLQPSTAAQVLFSHIRSREQSNNIQALAAAIGKAGKDWSPVIPCRIPNSTKQAVANYDLEDEGGTVARKGDPLFTWGLDEGVHEPLAASIAQALKTAADDPELRNKIWTPAAGKTVKVTEGDAHEKSPMLSADARAFKWTVTEQTDHYGVSVKPSSIRIDENDQFSIDCSNSYSRTLFAGYRRKLETDFETAVQELYSVNATNDIMGIPVPTLPTSLAFDLNGASEVELLLGSLGVSDWTHPVSDKGASLTYMWQYGIPAIFLVAGELLKSTETFRTILEDKELVKKVLIIYETVGIVGGGVEYGTNQNPKRLEEVADFTFGIILSEGLEKLGKWVLKQVGAGAMKSAMGPVGWVLRAAAVSVSFVRMGVTTGEVLSSPATVRIRVSRAIDVSLTLKPDPEHGEVGHPETAVWPSVATRYLVTFQYIDGTSRQLSGPLDRTTNGRPLHLLFEDVPAGGTFQIIAGVYSDTGWLAGTWQSEWRRSVPNDGTTLNMGEFTIVENLVPLSPDTHYQYKEEIQFADGDYHWKIGSPSQATIHALHGGDDGTLSELVDISLNNSAYQAGFAWRASGQNLYENGKSGSTTNQQLYSVQNLSVLENPGSRLISTEIGFTNQARTAYAPSTLRGDQIDQHNFVLDPRSRNLRQVLLREDQTSFGFEHEQLSWGRFPLQHVDALAVHPGHLAIACSFETHRMMILRLPEQGCQDKDAPEAVAVSGEGVRQGLMKGPKAMAVAPDGSILVLESLNNRVQAFDLKGNPVPCFTPGKELFRLETQGIQEDLDHGRVPEVFHQSLAASATTWCASVENAGALIESLNGGGAFGEHREVLAALALEGVYISHDPEQMDNPALSPVLRVDENDNLWTLADPRGQLYRLKREDDGIAVYELPAASEVEVQTPGKQWLITDKYLGLAWKLTPSLGDPGHTIVKEARSYFPIARRKGETITYLDMAAEAAGHVYLLYYRNDGASTTDYCLDIYTPQGQLLLQSPGDHSDAQGQNLVAGKFDVDIWRNLYALSFAPMPGLHGKVQPGIMHWMPTTPMFSLPLKAQKDLNDRNHTAVERDFKDQGVTLSSGFFITVIDSEGYWEVKDDKVTYHLYRSGNAIEVYSIKASSTT